MPSGNKPLPSSWLATCLMPYVSLWINECSDDKYIDSYVNIYSHIMNYYPLFRVRSWNNVFFWLFLLLFFMSFIWHIQTRGTFSYIQHISTYMCVCVYSNSIIHTYQHQHLHLWLPSCYTFLYLCIVKHGSHSQLPWSVPYLCVVYRPVLEYSVLP